MKKKEQVLYGGLPSLDRHLRLPQWQGRRFVILLDEVVFQQCLPLLVNRVEALQEAEFVEVPVGEECKDIEVAAQVWQTLAEGGHDRQTVLVCLGGGSVTDLGGFVASTYMRGIDRINIPTTLIGMADAAIGGKTAIDLGGVKNMVGTFCRAALTVLEPQFLHSLPADDLLAGRIEMLKTAAVADPQLYSALLGSDLVDKKQIAEVVRIKQRVVEADPNDHGIRRILNLGHTFGHAIEAHSLQRGKPLRHGHAVGIGMLAAFYLSVRKLGMPDEVFATYAQWLRTHAQVPFYGLKDIEAILAFMHHDKKNADGELRCVLLKNIAEPVINITISDNEVRDALLTTCK